MYSNESDPRFEVRPSTLPAAGRGLFAKTLLAMGDRLKVVGVSVQRDSHSDQCTHYADEYKIRVGDDRLLIPTGWAAFVNHSAQPNVEKVMDMGQLYLQATRRIDAGEELFLEYSEYARRAFGPM